MPRGRGHGHRGGIRLGHRPGHHIGTGNNFGILN